MTGYSSRIASYLAAIILIASGCSSAPKAAAPQPAAYHPTPSAATPADVQTIITETLAVSDDRAQTAGALQTLEKSSASAADAIKAIDIARDVAMNNLRNAGTTGFKRSDAVLQNGGHVRVRLDLTQGSMESTDRTLDLGINGDGFFRIRLNNKGDVAYTRLGNFFVNDRGELVLGLGEGYALSPPITIPAGTTSFSVAQDGQVSIVKAGSPLDTRIGQINLTRFLNPEDLKTEGDFFVPSATSGTPVDLAPGQDGAGTILDGFLEASNVNITHETVRLHFLNEWRASLMNAIGMRN